MIIATDRFELQQGSSHSMRVLVVEDDAKIASFVSKGLKQAGFSVDTTSDG